MKFEVRVSFAYLILATLWIILSDALLAAIPIPALVNTLQTYKGALFVMVTALLLFVLLRWELSLRRHSEQAVQRSESNFRYLFINNPLPMWVYDLETLRFLDVNAAATQQYGYSREEFLSMRILDIRPQEDVPRLLEQLKAERPPLQQSGLWRHRYRDGTIIDVEITSHQLDFAGRPAALVVAQNMTERVKAQTALHESNALLNAIINAAPLAIFRFDTNGVIQMCNPAAETIFGWSAAEMLGRRPPFVPPHLTEEFVGLLRRSLTGEPFVGYQTTRQRKDGTMIDVAVSAASLPDAQSVVSVVADITEVKQMEAERLENERLHLALNKEVELRNLRGRFMSMVSHEFRNPLAIIASSNSMLERYYDRMQPAGRAEHFATIDTQVKRLTELLDDILTILRLESIGPDFKPTALDLVELSSRLASEMRLQTQNARQIEFSSPISQAPIQGDAKMLRHAIGNLLSNAVKYSPPQSTVQLEIGTQDDQFVVRVKDQGIGIPPENLTRLFEPFYRADNVGDIPGSGLGLAITRQAAELHGGRLVVDSVVGVGSTFTIYLPGNTTTAAK